MALYREYDPNIDKKVDNVLFTNRLYNENISMIDVAGIEDFYKQNHYIPYEWVSTLLNFVIAYSRKGICLGVDSPLTSSMKGGCSTSANINYELLTKMGFKPTVFNVKELVNFEKPIHELCKFTIPVLIDNQIVNKEFILDPTFKQFCLEEGCRFNRYFEEKRGSNNKATPDPGYFLSLTEEGTSFATSLLYYGYFETTDENLKMYLDSFALSGIEANEYPDKSYIGNVSNLNVDVNYYRNKLNNSYGAPQENRHLIIETPLEQYYKYNKKSIKNFFNKKRNQELLNNTYGPSLNGNYYR